MPTSGRKAADVLTASRRGAVAGAGFALVYALLLPVTSPRLADVLDSPVDRSRSSACWSRATALNVLTDSVFLAINRVWDYLRLNGILLGVVKCGLPFLLAGAGAFGLYGSVGGAIRCCARRQPVGDLPARARSPVALAVAGAARRARFAAAGYVDLRAHRAAAAGVPADGDQRARLGPGRRLLHQLPGRHPAQRGHPRGRQRDVRRERARHPPAARASSARAG